LFEIGHSDESVGISDWFGIDKSFNWSAGQSAFEW
jgi:hypothetical protein